MEQPVLVIGAGLAGSEAAWQLAQRGIPVRLCEMRPLETTGAHQTGDPAEMVCSNSLRGDGIGQAPGVLKRELEIADSLIMMAAHKSRVPAGGAFAVDRSALSAEIERQLTENPLIERCIERLDTLPDFPTIVATGPLTAPQLAQDLIRASGTESLYFYDSVAPILDQSTLDQDVGWWANRRDDSAADYFNIPLDRDQYEAFIVDLRSAERIPLNDLDQAVHFEGCLAIEEMADRGLDTLRYGPMKPVGLDDPKTGRWPWALIQLRREAVAGSMMNLVGFQTRMKHGEQLRVLRKLPGLGKADFVRLGSMHRNTFLDSPRCLDHSLRLRSKKNVRIAGQLSGVEGYIESTMAGLVASLSLVAEIKDVAFELPPRTTASGSLLHYITDPEVERFQPMNTNFGLFERDEAMMRLRGRARKKEMGEKAVRDFAVWFDATGIKLATEEDRHATHKSI